MIKRSLVVVDASPRSATRLNLAQLLATVHKGEFTAMYGVLPTLLVAPWSAADGMAITANLMAELDDEQRRRSQTIFQQVCNAGRGSWVDGGDTPMHTLLQLALTHDLLLLGQPDPADGRAGAMPSDLIPASVIDSGRPALVIPGAGRFDSTEGPALVAWKSTREAARAISAAMPWLRRAPQVHLAFQPESDTAGPPIKALEHWLRLHGVRGPLQPHQLAAGDAGVRLLSLAADLGAALLVMGCYGHSRAREWVLGGVTRTVLSSMTLPVLMVH